MMHINGFLYDFWKARTFAILTNMSFTFLYPIQDILLPHCYGKLIESLTKNEDIIKNVLLVLGIFLFVELGFILSDWHDIYLISSVQTFTRQEIMKNVMKKYESNYSELFLGELMSKLVKVPFTVIVWYERLKTYVIPYVLVFGFAVCYFGSYDSLLGITLLITAIIYAAIIAGVPNHYCGEASTAKDQTMNTIHEEIEDTLRNFIALHGDTQQQEREVLRLAEYEELFTKKFAETMKCLMNTKVFTSLVILVFITVFIMRSYHLLRQKKLSTSSFSSLFLILIYVLNCMVHVENQMRDIIFDWGVICESDDLFDKHPLNPYDMKPKIHGDLPQDQGIGMKHIAFSFDENGGQILKDITFHVKKGETVVILGPIGSGKSTILKLLCKFNDPDDGIIYIDGKSYQDMDLKEIKSKVAYVPQNPILFNRTVYENITYGTTGVTRERVEMFLKELGVDTEFTNLEDGLDTKIGKSGSKLSGGQRQMVWTLRTYFKNPDIIILDEPTASLGEKAKETIKHVLDVLMKEKTTIIVTHDDSLLELADRKLYVQDGVISESKEGDKGNGNSSGSFKMNGGLLNF